LADTATPPVAKRSIRVCLSPALVGNYKLENTIVVLIDILRATTSICVAFAHGVEHIVPVETPEECDGLRRQGYLGAAERNGMVVPGFEIGNSPYSFMQDLRGKRIALTTTNGTHALHKAKQAKAIVVGAFANQSVLERWLRDRPENILMLCSGWKNNVNLEDSLFAGAMVEALADSVYPADDAGTMCRLLYQAANANKRFYLQHSSHYNRLIELELQRDVKFCLRRDTSPALPLYQDGRLVNLLAQTVPTNA
jgi:2-phosphosulfolactate phosphatase